MNVCCCSLQLTQEITRQDIGRRNWVCGGW